jgi:large-conductance mechanosensitive channel
MHHPVIVEQPLTVIALLAAIVSMVLSSIALWPQWKHGLSVVRDFVLWAALVFVVVIVLNAQARRPQDAAAPATPPEAFRTTPSRSRDLETLPAGGVSRSKPVRYAPSQ